MSFVILNGSNGETEVHALNRLVESVERKLEQPKYASTFLLGFDLKKTPSGNWYIVEVNGRNSGFRGLELVNQDFSETQFRNEIKERHGMITTNYANDLLNAFLNYLGYDDNLDGKNDEKTKVFINALLSNMFFNEKEFEDTISDKVRHKELLPERLVTPFVLVSKEHGDEDIKKWIGANSRLNQDFEHDLIVVKDPFSSQGAGVNVYNFRNFSAKKFLRDNLLVVEPFVRSKHFFDAPDGLARDACMRFGTFANVHESGIVEFTHAGGYWRLSPRPIEDKKARLKSRYTANFSRKAIAVRATEEDILEAKDIVEFSALHMLSKFYNLQFHKRS